MNKPIVFMLLFILQGCQSHKPWHLAVTPDMETEAVNQGGDAADDPALWVHATDAEQSLILGTQKKQGLYSYDLSGQIRQFIPDGRLNNVDIRQAVTVAGRSLDIAAASNRSNNRISLFLVDPQGNIRSWDSVSSPVSGFAEVYGFCMGHVQDRLYFVVTGKDGDAELYQLDAAGEQLQLIRTLKIPSQSEGCVINDDDGSLYIGEEAAGVWRFHVSDPSVAELVIRVDGSRLQADVEGLALLRSSQRTYLMVSSQGNNQFPLYDVADYRHIKSVVVNSNERFDKVTGTDGIDINQALSSKAFPQGVLMTQDDRNTAPRAHQNFKVVSLEQIFSQLD
jgi:3-phytase